MKEFTALDVFDLICTHVAGTGKGMSYTDIRNHFDVRSSDEAERRYKAIGKRGSGMKYCRYCSWCVCGDAYYCGCYGKVLNRVDKATNCKDFVESELGDVDTGRMYKPRPRRKKVETISMMDGGKEE